MKQYAIMSYEYDELPEKIQEKIREKLWDINIFHDWYEFTIDWFQERLNDCGLSCKHIYFDSDPWRITNMENLQVYDFEKLADTFLKCISGKINIEFDSLYELFNSIYVDNRYFVYDVCNCDIDFPGHFIDNIIHQLDHWLDRLRSEFASCLMQEYEYLTSQEAIEETIRANEYQFDKNGGLFHETI